MAPESGRTPPGLERGEPGVPGGAGAAGDAAREAADANTVVARLFHEGWAFDFFQAVRLIERLQPSRRPVGRRGPPGQEVARFRAQVSLDFPASSIYEIARPQRGFPIPVVTTTFLGLFGPSGVLPRHYTELLLQLHYRSKDIERHALRDWFDLFNHRFLSFFYRAWEKYRFYIPYERQAYELAEPDSFSQACYSLIGLGTKGLRNRLRVAVWRGEEAEEVRGRVDDLWLVYYAGLLSRQARSAYGLEAMLSDYFELPIRVEQFTGQWLGLEPAAQTRLGALDGHSTLGTGTLLGARVWDVQGRVRVRVGPLSYEQFSEFLPDRSPQGRHQSFFLLMHLVRFYLGPEFDADVQLVLAPGQVPACNLTGAGLGARLGWNTWLTTAPPPRVVDDVILAGDELTWLNAAERAAAYD